MSDIIKSKPLDLEDIDATTITASGTLRETFSGLQDEEYGLNPNQAANANADDADEFADHNDDVIRVSSLPPGPAPQQKNKTMWMIGATVLVIALGVIIAVSTGGGGGEETSAASTATLGGAAPEAPVVILEDVTPEAAAPEEAVSAPVVAVVPEEPSIETIEETVAEEMTADVIVVEKPNAIEPTVVVLDNDELINVSSDDSGTATPPIFEPEVSVGDSALLNPSLTETVAGTPEPSASPSKEPTPEPTLEPTNEPTPAPTPAPTNEPTDEPTPEPTSEPTPEPTTPEPTSEPTKKPVIQLDLSSWGNFNWSGETPSPTSSPTTTEPTSGPTKKPTDSPTPEPTNAPTSSPTPKDPYFMGDTFYTFTEDDVSLDVSTGLSVRVLAKTGSPVQFANGDESKDDWHVRTDAAGLLSMNPEDPLNSGYVYLSNSEEESGGGGVYGLYFDKDGNVIDYQTLLKGTTDNCGGGYTPWNTWVSCEEFSEGQCWQIDPISGEAEKTELGGDGGRYESVAVDNRNPANPVFFTTEDDEEGAFRRFVASGSGWDALHSEGEHSFLNILSGNTFEWTDDLDVGRASASKFFPNTEGVQVHEGKVYFMAKKLQRLLILDLETNTYVTEDTGKKFYGEGDFGDQPDQNLFGPTRKYMYFTEDGGTNPGVYARYGTSETYFTMFQGNLSEEDETVGIALSPDHLKFYAALQGHGMVFELTRDDGLPFE